MRNILEATNTHYKGKTVCFSGRSVLSRHECPCKNLTDARQASLAGEESQFLCNASFSLGDITGFATRDQLTPFQHFLPEKCKVPVIPDNIPNPIISKNTIAAGNPGDDAFCIKQKNNRNIDCTITPIGKLKKDESPGKIPGTGALGVATARPGNPANDIITSVNRWKRMATGAVNQP